MQSAFVGVGHAPASLGHGDDGHGDDGHGWHEKFGRDDGQEHVFPHVAKLTVKHGTHENGAVMHVPLTHGWHDTFGWLGGQ